MENENSWGSLGAEG
jgi:hypothetical protein